MKPPARWSAIQEPLPSTDYYGHPSRFPWRFALYAVVILYLFVDLYWLGGPLSRYVKANVAPSGDGASRGWVALVYGTPILREQLDRAVESRLFRRAKRREDISGQELLAAELAALDELIEDQILKTYIDGEPIEIDEGDIAARIAHFEAQFPSASELEMALAARRSTRAELEQLFREEGRQRSWIQSRIAEASAVSDEEVRSFFQRHADAFALPERRRARHIFLSTVDVRDREEEIHALARKLESGEQGFGELATASSEDENSSRRGGDLGVFSKVRMPRDFIEAIWDLREGERSRPIQTEIGWHIVEMREHLPSRHQTVEEVAPEIRAYLESSKRSGATEALKAQLRHNASNNVEIYYQNLAGIDDES